MYSVSQKIPHEDLWQSFQNGWEFFNQILHAYYAFLSTLEYKLLLSYAVLSATTQRAFRSMVDILSTLWYIMA